MAAFAVDFCGLAQESTIKARQFSECIVFFSFTKRWNKKRPSLAWFLHIMMVADVDQEKNNTCTLVACHVLLPAPVAFSPTIKSGTFFRLAPSVSCGVRPLFRPAKDSPCAMTLSTFISHFMLQKSLQATLSQQATHHPFNPFSLLFLFFFFLFSFSQTDAKVLRRKSPWRRHPRMHDQPS